GVTERGTRDLTALREPSGGSARVRAQRLPLRVSPQLLEGGLPAGAGGRTDGRRSRRGGIPAGGSAKRAAWSDAALPPCAGRTIRGTVGGPGGPTRAGGRQLPRGRG